MANNHTTKQEPEMSDIVDENDEVTGQFPHTKVLENGLLHRVAWIFLISEDKRIYANKRSASKTINPGKWDLMFGGGVRSAEAYEDAAERELLEETGLSSPLTFMKKVRYERGNDRCFASVYFAWAEDDIRLDPKEITEGKWLTFEELPEFIDTNDLTNTSLFLIEELLEELREVK